MAFRRFVMLSLALLLLHAGCDAPVASFRSNLVYTRKIEREALGKDEHGEQKTFRPQRTQEVAEVLAAMFGTPDEPALPAIEGIEQAIDLNKVRLAAGPVRSDATGSATGLYREHCAHCHGVTGDGRGPTAAFLNPYPRDYRSGVFKFKSTPKGGRPTDEDLHTILVNGIPGTAMPSFKLLDDVELESLVHYVKYLSLRGEVERALLFELSQLSEGEDENSAERLINVSLLESKSPDDVAAFVEQLEYVKERAGEVAEKWAAASDQAVAIEGREPLSDEELAAAVRRGKAIFFGEIANCVKCHGELALGDGQTTDVDDWTKEYYDPQNAASVAALESYLAIGALPPRNIRPRNLRQGIFRGGRRPIDLYWRIRNGIDGTPMPAALMKDDDAGPEVKGLTEADLWDLIEYVRHLPYDDLSRPRQPAVENVRAERSS